MRARNDEPVGLKQRQARRANHQERDTLGEVWLSNAGLIVSAAALGGCLSDPHRPEQQSGYRASAVRFDPANGDYLSQPGFNGAPTDSQKGMFSMWLRFEGDDGHAQRILDANEIGLDEGIIVRTADNHIEFNLNQCSGLSPLTMDTAGVYTVASGWIHLMASWDLGQSIFQLYVNGQPDLAGHPALTSFSICYNVQNL
jgi:hypothetical protein